MDAAERAAVRQIIGGSVFVRLADEDGALLASDAPRRMDAYSLGEAITRLQAEGYAAWVTERNLLAIDWGELRWHSFGERHQACVTLAVPNEEAQHALYALARLLIAHPAPLHDQPRALLRRLIKAGAFKDGLVNIAPELTASCAERLRRHEALPSAATGLLVQALHKPCDGGEVCP